MRKYLIKRILQIVLTFFIFLTVLYIILQAQPGDITDMYTMDPRVPPEVRVALRARLGLDKPLHLQYLQYLKNFVTGNLGLSFSHYPREVWDILKERLPRTVTLFLLAYLCYFFLGFQLGKLIAWRRKGAVDYAATVTGVVLWTIYTPWWGLLLIWIFAYKLRWLPIGKFLDPMLWRNFPDISANAVFQLMLLTGGAAVAAIFIAYRLARRYGTRRARKVAVFSMTSISLVAIGTLLGTTTIGYLALDIIKRLVLPILTLTTIGFGGYMLLMRDSMLEVVREDYVMVAKAKGLPDRVVRDRHAARNALLPIVTSFILAIATVAEGGIITETIFSWPGVGLTILNAVLDQDMPLAMGALAMIGILLLIGHLVADIMYAYIDPRIRYK